MYNFLPLGWRVINKIEQIIREELDKAGAQEVLMPAAVPAELYVELVHSNRAFALAVGHVLQAKQSMFAPLERFEFHTALIMKTLRQPTMRIGSTVLNKRCKKL